MSILERVSTMLRANVNDLLDRAENPEALLNRSCAIWKTRSSKRMPTSPNRSRSKS